MVRSQIKTHFPFLDTYLVYNEEPSIQDDLPEIHWLHAYKMSNILAIRFCSLKFDGETFASNNRNQPNLW